ncbi:hypothetical protein ACFQJ6_03840, partial [Halorussus caseinilyticus]
EVLDVDADAEFEQANLSIDYDEQAVGDESDLAVYTYDPELQTYVKLLGSGRRKRLGDGDDPHFSTFVAMNQTAWQNYMQKRAKPKPKYALNESFSDLSGWNCTGSCSTGAGRAVIGQNSSLFYSDDVSAACTGPHFPDNGECPVNGGDGDDDDDSDDDDDDDDEGTSDPSPPKQFDPRITRSRSRFRQIRSKSRSRCRLSRSRKNRTRVWKSLCRSGPRPGLSWSCRATTASETPTTPTSTRRSRIPTASRYPSGFTPRTSQARVPERRVSR